MGKRSVILTLLLTVIMSVAGYLLWDSKHSEEERWSKTIKPNTINAVIGDESYRAMYSAIPAKPITEKERITTHLKYVRQKLLQRDMMV